MSPAREFTRRTRDIWLSAVSVDYCSILALYESLHFCD